MNPNFPHRHLREATTMYGLARARALAAGVTELDWERTCAERAGR
jgi:hypothetical protein